MKKVISIIFLRFQRILMKYGFTEGTSVVTGYSFDFARLSNHKKDELWLSYFIEDRSIRYNGLHSHVAFTDVVKILKLIDPNSRSTNIILEHPQIDKNRNIIDKLVNTVIVENNKLLEPEFEQLLTALEEYICRYILPFFDRVSSLQVVNDEIIDVVAHMELGKYISGDMPLKKQIIMKLCNNPKYDDFVEWMETLYQRILLKTDDPLHFMDVEAYEHFKKLTLYLASGAYLDLIKK